MKSLRCRIGIHREFTIEEFPAGSRSALIVGVECERCKQVRCVNQMERPTMSAAVERAFSEAQAWLEKQTGQRIFGPFVHFR